MPDQIVGAMGWPIEHSLSPAMHNAAFAALGMTDWRYEKMAIPPDIVRHSLKQMRENGVIGVNVTIPHKRAVMPHVRPDEIARRVGAVNTIDFRDNSATNTDVQGFMGDLMAHDVLPRGLRVVILGAGGAARAAVYGLVESGALVQIVNRTPENSAKLISEMRVDAEVADLSAVATTDVIVNCTSVGLYPHIDESPLPDDAIFKRGVVLYDMIYRPAQTRLMRQVEAAGGQAIGGLGMLVRQGAAAFTIWTGIDAPIVTMFNAAKAALTG